MSLVAHRATEACGGATEPVLRATICILCRAGPARLNAWATYSTVGPGWANKICQWCSGCGCLRGMVQPGVTCKVHQQRFSFLGLAGATCVIRVVNRCWPVPLWLCSCTLCCRYVGRLKSNGKVFDKTGAKPFAFRLGERASTQVA